MSQDPPVPDARSADSAATPEPERAIIDPPMLLPEMREAALYARLSALGIAWKTYQHAPVFTVEEARALRGVLPGGHSKNLFLEDRAGKLFLVVAREELQLDLNALAKALARPRFSFGKPDLLAAALGITPGAVTPFALMNDGRGLVTPVFDEGLLAADPVNFHPLRNDRTTARRRARTGRHRNHHPLDARGSPRPGPHTASEPRIA